jgi:predicted dehydrogenase/threonine dehydrogenase-like Zn-dependent dehydrogenase
MCIRDRKVIKAIQTEGILATASAVSRTLDLPIPFGYSCAGVVAEVGEGITDIVLGNRVACGGGGMAYHAGVVVIPRNLCVPVPDEVSFEEAAFTTVGSIALQGIRIADRTLGEHVVVIGLGLVGLLTVEILKAAGCRVIGIDIDPERVRWVKKQGICKTIERQTDNIVEQVLEMTDGNGADAVIITAAVNSNDPVSLAGRIVRYKGRVVVVGRTEMHAPRETYLFKELELCTSLAYGPGTGDDSYELRGNDYPIGYVRWTENRNMQYFLDLVKDKKVDLGRLVTHKYSINEAIAAFETVANPAEGCVGAVLTYESRDNEIRRVIQGSGMPVKKVASNLSSSIIRVGVIGTGSFATNVMLPLLAKRKDVEIAGLVSSTGIKAVALGKKYNVGLVSSDANELIEADGIDCLFILTRHDSHARYAEKGLLHGKHIFVEKPLAMTKLELENVTKAQEESGKTLMIGFNRRYSPLAMRMKKHFSKRCQPMIVTFRGNVGYRPPEHWLHNPVEGGGVIIGEACHYIDFCRWLVDSPITSVKCESVGKSNTNIIPEDNVRVNLGFEDGSLGTILYISNGAPSFGRESCEAHAENKSVAWNDFRQLKMVNHKLFPHYSMNFIPQKGYKEELDELFLIIRKQGISFPDWLIGQLDSSRAAILAAESINLK